MTTPDTDQAEAARAEAAARQDAEEVEGQAREEAERVENAAREEAAQVAEQAAREDAATRDDGLAPESAREKPQTGPAKPEQPSGLVGAAARLLAERKAAKEAERAAEEERRSCWASRPPTSALSLSRSVADRTPPCRATAQTGRSDSA